MDADDQRRASRRRTLYDARVVFNNRFSIIACTVRDLSATGAKIGFPHATPLPAEVELEIFKLRQNFRARVMWSDGKTHGLMFLAPEEQAASPPVAVARSSSEGAIQSIIDEARHRIAREAGVPPDAVRLKLEIDT